VDPERNHNKFYELTAEMPLFGPTIPKIDIDSPSLGF